jgi:lipoyl(octanoyl) transferase
VLDAGVVPYRDAFAMQKLEVGRVQGGGGDEVLILLEHPHVITLGRNATGEALVAGEEAIARRGVEIVETDRGGDVTYHGPGQLVGYPIVALEPGRRDIRRYVHDLEEVLVRTLADFGVSSQRHPLHRGVWTGDKKIASLGIRISRWVTCHGFALNVSTDLEFYSLIDPCGIAGCQMTSMEVELGVAVGMDAVKSAIASHFASVFDRDLIISDIRQAAEAAKP